METSEKLALASTLGDKMKRIAIIVLSLIITLCLISGVFGQPKDPKDIEGWSKSRWGMTEEEILKAFKGEAVRLKGKEIYHGAYATIGINDLKIDGHKYQVRFLMDDVKKTLQQVNIELKDDELPAARSIFRELEVMLVKKHGPLSLRTAQKEKDLSCMITTWSFPSTVIKLLYLDVRPINLRMLVIIYRQPHKEILVKYANFAVIL